MKNNFLFGFLFLLLMVSAVSASTTVYKENSDQISVVNYPDPIDLGKITDGDWDTFGHQGFWIGGHGSLTIDLVYSAPEGFNSAVWRVKDQGGVFDLNVPSECIVDGTLNLQVHTESNFEGLSNDPGATTTWKCGNQILRSANSQETSTLNLYEEAVIWSVGEATNGCDYYTGDTINLPQITTDLVADDSLTHKLYLACLYELPSGEKNMEDMTGTQNCQTEAQTFTPENAGDYNYNLVITFRERQWNPDTSQWETLGEGINNQSQKTYTVCQIPDDDEGFSSFIDWVKGLLCSTFGWFC